MDASLFVQSLNWLQRVIIYFFLIIARFSNGDENVSCMIHQYDMQIQGSTNKGHSVIYWDPEFFIGCNADYFLIIFSKTNNRNVIVHVFGISL